LDYLKDLGVDVVCEQDLFGKQLARNRRETDEAWAKQGCPRSIKDREWMRGMISLVRIPTTTVYVVHTNGALNAL
jgi:hypothetical protein